MDEVDALVRRVDENRWLASRFAPAAVRKRLVAIYAVFHELSRAHIVAKEPSLAAVRLAWWRDALTDIRAGGAPQSHPVVRAYAAGSHDLPSEFWTEIIDALGDPRPSWEAVSATAEHVQGGLMKLALYACGAHREVEAASVRALASAWGVMGACLKSDGESSGARASGIERAIADYERGRAGARGFGGVAFPGIGYVTLVPLYLTALKRGEAEVPLLLRQARLIMASATGRL